MGQVAHQLVAPVGRVGPHHDGTGQRGGLEPEDELGDVVEQDGDVEGHGAPPGPTPTLRPQPGAPGRGGRDHLGVAQAQVARPQSQGGVVGPCQDAAGDGLGGRGRVGGTAGRVSWAHGISKSKVL